jgi:mycothiol synthase
MTVSGSHTLTEADVADIEALVSAATAADGVSPLDEAAMLELTAPGSARHLLLREAASLLGYAQLAGTAALVVHPGARGAGHGSELLAALLAEGGRPLSVWAHGDLPAAAALARAHHMRRGRELWQMRRPLDDRLPEVRWPAGVSVRTFLPGRDDAAWLAVNAEAFSDHPEQGRTTQADLDARTSAPWFDLRGFFLAERDGALVGFHWTKVHSEPAPIGEVYVVGVAPSAQGSGLGRALTLHGLHHLRSQGLAEVLLYVEADNTPAVAVYQRLGFETASVDVAYTAE